MWDPGLGVTQICKLDSLAPIFPPAKDALFLLAALFCAKHGSLEKPTQSIRTRHGN